MAPSNLQGLNIVHPVPPSNPYLSDADLLAVPPFPDLNAQLDLWTNLNFQSDEPLHSNRPGESPSSEKEPADSKKRGALDDSSEDDPDRYNDPDEDVQHSGIAETHSHENVVMGTVLPSILPSAPASSNSHPQLPPFDINSLLAGFGIDPFMAPPAPMPAQAPNPTNTIAHLLSLHASSFRPAPSQPIPSPTQPTSAQSPPQPSQAPNPASTPTTTAKRARTSRNSISSTTTEAMSPQTPESPEEKPSATPVTAAEDKRRRNTAASARFRLKKKEREAALERKAKELEVRVGELEKECEALRRENGWLKGLVVGVTGAGAVQQQQLQQHQHQSASASPAPSSESAGTKRLREDDA